MADLTSIRNGLAANLATVPNMTVSKYVVLEPKPPLFIIRPHPDTLIDHHQAMVEGAAIWHMIVEAYAGALDDEAAQQLLDVLCSSGASSVRAAIEADVTLGGACAQAVVVRCRNYREFASPENTWLITATWDIDIHA